MAYTWGKGIETSNLTKKQVNKLISNMKKRGYVVPQNIREQIRFSKKDTIKSIEKRIAEKSDFEYSVFKKLGKGQAARRTTGLISGSSALKLEQQAKEYNAKVQRLKNLKQYKGKDLQWTTFDIRNKNLGNTETVKKLRERFKKTPTQIARFEQKKNRLPWDNLVKSVNKGPFSKELGETFLNALEEQGYKEAALNWKKGDKNNKFGLLMQQEQKAIQINQRYSWIWAVYASDQDLTWGSAVTDIMDDLMIAEKLSPGKFLEKYGPKDKEKQQALVKELRALSSTYRTVADKWDDEPDLSLSELINKYGV